MGRRFNPDSRLHSLNSRARFSFELFDFTLKKAPVSDLAPISALNPSVLSLKFLQSEAYLQDFTASGHSLDLFIYRNRRRAG